MWWVGAPNPCVLFSRVNCIVKKLIIPKDRQNKKANDILEKVIVNMEDKRLTSLIYISHL